MTTARLIVEGSDGTSEVVCGTVLTLGRDKSNDVVLRDKQVSRRHAIIQRLGDADFYLVDVGSSNGCHVNGQRIVVPTRLQDEDRMRLGETAMIFHQESFTPSADEEAEKTTLVQASGVEKITILVCDIRGYTRISETVPISALTRIMSLWFQEVAECVLHQGGVVDKFIGDCVYARWITGEDAAQTLVAVLRAAVEINRLTTAIGEQCAELDEALRIGVGINTGHAAVGIGRDATALGDAVNLAFRLESASKELGTDIVVAYQACEGLSAPQFEARQQRLRVKGKSEPVSVCTLDFADAEALLATLDSD